MGGTGDQNDPFTISTCADFKTIDDNPSSNYVITADLGCTSDGNTMRQVNPFAGNLDGQNHTITVNTNSGSVNGLFNSIVQGTVSNLTIAGTIASNDDSDSAVGALTVLAQQGVISNVAVCHPPHILNTLSETMR